MTTSTGVFDCSIESERNEGIEAAAAAIRKGDIVVLPTDTVYGVAADAFAPDGVAALLAAKGRGRDMPVPVLVATHFMLAGVVDEMGDQAEALAEKHWPGGLSLVVKHPVHLGWDLGETKGTVMVRMPDNEIALELIARTGPLAVSSANRSGHPPATTMIDARLQLGAVVSVYLDGGESTGNVPSSIVDLTGDQPRLLRVGVLSFEELKETVPDLLDLGTE